MPSNTEELASFLANLFIPPLAQLDSLALMDLIVHHCIRLKGRPLTNCMDSTHELIGTEDAADIVSACSSVSRDKLSSDYCYLHLYLSREQLLQRQSLIRERLAADITIDDS